MILLEVEHAAYVPGSVLRGRVALEPLPGHESRKVELSVLWETEGKGDTDVGVALHRVLADGDVTAARATHSFDAQLPMLPLSYQGTILKIGWRVRVRRLATFGDDEVTDHVFRLGWPE